MVPRSHLPAHIVLMNTSRELITSPTIVVVPWVDPVVDEAGASVFSRYVEMYWLPVLGPSALWMMRRMVMGFETFPAGYEMDCATTATDLSRCLHFGAAQPHQGGLAVRCYLPAVSKRHLQRLSAPLRDAHDAWSQGT
jgi:hypothetical protein